MDWVMHEYQHLDDKMFLQEDVVVRKVFNQKNTDRVPSYFKKFDDALEDYHEALVKRGRILKLIRELDFGMVDPTLSHIPGMLFEFAKSADDPNLYC
ncbi:uncharacterized protein LOC120666291 isoform X4 [Panicum virgatum]|uniref:uncharacterized protein LOC120666291 isoform X4 n=1 Tax=Panicum virgatum TaxID=38727 RepID=UPI0019D563D0|nr:uncharacterized protein LOC120666291 isoform X4 [Panicum virgatum]